MTLAPYLHPPTSNLSVRSLPASSKGRKIRTRYNRKTHEHQFTPARFHRHSSFHSIVAPSLGKVSPITVFEQPSQPSIQGILKHPTDILPPPRPSRKSLISERSCMIIIVVGLIITIAAAITAVTLVIKYRS